MTEDRRTRDPVRTRQLILDAAAGAVLADGSGASLETIARTAGVSKGGLLHHFPSKEELLIVLAEHQLGLFKDAVEAQLDPDDRAPGRLVRAYVRAALDQLDAGRVRDEATLMAALSTIPEVVRRAQEDGRMWKEAFVADGLDPGRAAVITRAADGTSAAALFEGTLAPAEVAWMREQLLALSYGDGPLICS